MTLDPLLCIKSSAVALQDEVFDGAPAAPSTSGHEKNDGRGFLFLVFFQIVYLQLFFDASGFEA